MITQQLFRDAFHFVAAVFPAAAAAAAAREHSVGGDARHIPQ